MRSVGVRRFQGIGKSTRAGRMAAAETALRKLRSLMPGIEVPHGELPEEWMRYVCCLVFEPPTVQVERNSASGARSSGSLSTYQIVLFLVIEHHQARNAQGASTSARLTVSLSTGMLTSEPSHKNLMRVH